LEELEPLKDENDLNIEQEKENSLKIIRSIILDLGVFDADKLILVIKNIMNLEKAEDENLSD